MARPTHDVIVVGSGAGGGAAAWALARGGARVLVLEAGPWFDPHQDYRLHLDDWEQQGFPVKHGSQGQYSYASMQGLESRWQHLRSWNHQSGPMVRGPERVAAGYLHVRGVGGTTLHFVGEAHRMHPQSMLMRTRFGVAADWPMSYDELEPYYTQAERIIGVAGPGADRQRPRSAPYPLPPHPLSHASEQLRAGARKLGMSWVPNARAALSAPYQGRPACNYCGNCTRGCPRTDKGSVDVTFLRQALASGNCELRANCQVTEVVAGDGDRVAGVIYSDGKGRLRNAAAAAVVLACGALETPRLLMLSRSKHSPQGLANESGEVGRNFMETLYWMSSGWHPGPLGSHRGLPADSICWDFNAPDAIPKVNGGCRFSSAVAEAEFLGPIHYAARAVPGWGLRHKQRMRESFGNVLTVGAIGENLPNAGSFVDLDSVQKDHHGRPVARIHSRLPDTELKRLTFMADKSRALLRAAGVAQIFEELSSYDRFIATHAFGTCRMGRDARSSVVDGYGRSHRWRNLFIADASVFPSSGGGESPSLTIEALAIRTAARLRDLAARGEM